MAFDLKNTVLGESIKKAYQLKLDQIFIEIFERRDVVTFVIELNRMRLNKGLTTQNKEIKNLRTGSIRYKESTVKMYRKIGRMITVGQPYSMRYTGKFHRSIRIESLTKNYFVVNADPLKDDGTNLFKVYGTFLLGASETDLQLLRQKVLPLILEKIRYKLTI